MVSPPRPSPPPLPRAPAEPRALDAAARAAAAGDVAAFERFHRGTVARAHSLARRLLGAARADEAVQEVYLRAWKKLAGWRGEGSAEAWFHELARNTLLNELARRGPLALADEEALARQPARAERPGERLDLEAAIATLPDGARAVFVLHDVEGRSHEEIAERLALAVGTSKSQLHRARMLLRARLGEDHAHG